jgi:Domain of unknown function (DU1801)
MSTLKTRVNDASVTDFLNSVSDEKKRQDSFVLLELFQRITGEQPKMWGTSIVGFGSYHYKSERSSQEGDWLITGFSPRKQALTLYLGTNLAAVDTLLDKLGKHTTGRGCLYIKKLSDVDPEVLEHVVETSFKTTMETHNT